MSHASLIIAGVILLNGCTMAVEPEPPAAPTVPLSMIHETILAPHCPLERVEVTLLPRHEALAERTPTALGGSKKPGKPLSPVQLVSHAQQAARIEPSERGYFGGSGEQVYTWTAGKVYTVYLSPKQGTGIFLPPGEKLVSGLYLSPEEYEVTTKRAGIGERAYDALLVRPMVESGEVQAFLLTESGRRYLLHFVVGKTAMLAVTFEGVRVPVTQTRSEEPALVLPRPLPGPPQ